jgi:altronate hydrolase
MAMQTLKIHSLDDMAVALTDLVVGQIIDVDGNKITLATDVQAKHKFYLVDLPKGTKPKFYGMPVGIISRDVRQGEIISRDNLDNLEANYESLSLELSSWQPPVVTSLPKSFQGYRRPDGKYGTRNHLLIAYTVICTQHIAQRIVSVARRAYGFETDDPWEHYAREGIFPQRETVKSYPGIDDIVLLHHSSGCGMADHGDLETLLKFIAEYVRHPNVVGAVVLGLGCEKTAVHQLRAEVGETWKPVVYLSHQSFGEEDMLLRSALDALKDLLPEADRHKRVKLPISSLNLGLECGGSDGFSGITANPVLGFVSELVVAQGGGVLLPETPEMTGAESILAARAINSDVAKQLLALVHNFHAYAADSDLEVNENLSPGNLREGLTTIQIKALGAIQKAGNAPVSGFLSYTEPIAGPGLYLLNTPGYDVPSTSALVASGANLIIFTTGMGTPTGNPITPVIKVSSNSEISKHMSDIIDFDAGRILEGESVEMTGHDLYHLALQVASGQSTANEFLGHRESAFWNQQVML